MHRRDRLGGARTQHGDTRRDHHQREEEQKTLARHELCRVSDPMAAPTHPRHRTGSRTANARFPPPVANKIDECIERDREHARPDGAMRVFHADDVKQQRHRENRAAAANDPEGKAYPTPDSIASASCAQERAMTMCPCVSVRAVWNAEA